MRYDDDRCSAVPAAGGVDVRLVGAPGEPRAERLYRRMRFIRRFEESLLDLFSDGSLNGTTHACIGQEADAVAIIGHLGEDDHAFSNHRCHGHFLARTGDALGLMAEIMGKPEGVCGGIRAAIIAAIKDAGYLHTPRRPPRPHHARRNPPPTRPR